MDSSKDDVEHLVTRAPFDELPRADHREELRKRALAAYDKSQLAPRPVASLLLFQSFWRWIMARPIPRIGIPVVVIALVSSGFFLFFPARSGFAFEDFVEPLLSATTARCKIVARLKDQPAFTFNSMFRGTVSRQESNDMGSVTIHDEATGTSLTLIPKEMRANILQAVNREPEQSEGGGFLQAMREQLLDLRQDKRITRVSLGERKLADGKLIGYRITGPNNQLEIWGDQETGLPHTIISNMAAFPSVEVTMTDFEFDVELDDSLFSVVPPAGYTVTRDVIDMSLRSETGFIAALQQFAEFNNGVYPDEINFTQVFKLFQNISDKLADRTEDERKKEVSRLRKIISGGFAFPLQLVAETDAAYAGKGVNRDDAEKPIFWYRPEGPETYRVIYADLSVGESDAAPDVPGAAPMNGR